MHSWHRASALIAASFVLGAACSREPSSTAAPAGPASDPAASAAAVKSEPTPSEPPAESGLAIKRGIALLGQDRMTFRPCGDDAELWVLDQTDGVLVQSFSAANPSTTPLSVYVEAYGERTPVTDEHPAARAYAGVLVLEEVLYAAVENAAGRCDEPPGDYVVMARGNEPFWAVEVSDARMIWRQADAPTEIALDAPQTMDEEGAVRYSASGTGHQIELSIDAQPCRDSMSGDFFAYSARAALDGKPFTGCARVGE